MRFLTALSNELSSRFPSSSSTPLTLWTSKFLLWKNPLEFSVLLKSKYCKELLSTMLTPLWQWNSFLKNECSNRLLVAKLLPEDTSVPSTFSAFEESKRWEYRGEVWYETLDEESDRPQLWRPQTLWPSGSLRGHEECDWWPLQWSCRRCSSSGIPGNEHGFDSKLWKSAWVMCRRSSVRRQRCRRWWVEFFKIFFQYRGCMEVFKVFHQYRVQQRFVEQRGGVWKTSRFPPRMGFISVGWSRSSKSTQFSAFALRQWSWRCAGAVHHLEILAF